MVMNKSFEVNCIGESACHSVQFYDEIKGDIFCDGTKSVCWLTFTLHVLNVLRNHLK